MFPQLIAPRMRGLDGLYRTAVGTVQIGPPVQAGPFPDTLVSLMSLIASRGAIGLQIKGTAGAYAARLFGSGVSGQSYGPLIRAGTTNADTAIQIQNSAGGATFFTISGDGHGQLGPSATLGLSWDVNGHAVVAAPSSAGAALSLPAGTTAVYPLLINSGTNLTTPVVGAVEFDGTALYFTPAASSRAATSNEYVCVMNGTKTLTSQTAAQAIFNSTTNGAVTLPIGTYIFECQFQLTAMSTVTGGFGFALGGAATFTQGWSSLAVNAAAVTATNAQMTYDTAANTAIGTATTAGVAHAMIKGIIRVTVAGTVIPQVSLITAAAAVVSINSYFKCYPVGNGTATTVGNWS